MHLFHFSFFVHQDFLLYDGIVIQDNLLVEPVFHMNQRSSFWYHSLRLVRKGQPWNLPSDFLLLFVRFLPSFLIKDWVKCPLPKLVNFILRKGSFYIVKRDWPYYSLRPRVDLPSLLANTNFMNPFEIVHDIDNRGSLGNSSANSWSLRWPQLFSVLPWKLYWKILLPFSNFFF